MCIEFSGFKKNYILMKEFNFILLPSTVVYWLPKQLMKFITLNCCGDETELCCCAANDYGRPNSADGIHDWTRAGRLANY